MRRRKVFDGSNPPSLEVILHEAALWCGIGGPVVMQAQLQYLAAVSEHPRITVQVLPFGAPPRGTPFILLGRPDGSEVLYAESYVRGQFHDSPEAVAEARAAYERLRADALAPAQSLFRIQHAMEAYTCATSDYSEGNGGTYAEWAPVFACGIVPVHKTS